MLRQSTTTRLYGFRGIVLAVVCALLVAFSATIQVAHAHELSGPAHSDCSLCMIAHAGIVPHAPEVIPAPVEHAAGVEILPAETPRDCFIFGFYTRPPPAEAAFFQAVSI